MAAIARELAWIWRRQIERSRTSATLSVRFGSVPAPELRARVDERMLALERLVERRDRLATCAKADDAALGRIDRRCARLLVGSE